MTRYYLQTKKTSLSYSISDTETTMRLTALTKLDGTSISAADIGDYMTGTFDPGTSKEEIFSIASSGVTVNADGTIDITGVVRGLREGGTAGYSTGGYSAEHGAGAVVVFSNNPQLYNQLANKSNANTFTEQNIFSGYAPQTDTDPVNPNDMTRLSYVQALVLGTLTTIDVVVPGTAGETIADGNLIYLNTDNKWYKTDADTASTVNNVLLGIAKGAGVTNNPITNGILLQGTDNAQSGLTGGEVQYASNTAGAISNTPGTVEVTVGVAKSTTELYFSPRFNQQITEDQQDALAGTSGTPSATNKFVTNDDTSSTPVASKVVRYNSLGLLVDNANTQYPLGESFTGATTPQPAVLISDIVQPIFDGVTTYGAAASPQIACKIIPRQNTTVATVLASLYRTTDPSVNMSVEIQTDNAGVPSNTPVSNGSSNTVATSTMTSGEFRYFNFTFSTPPTLVAGTTYHVVFKTSATNANQITIPTLTNASKYASFSGATYNGTSWTSNAVCPSFEIIPSTVGSYSLWRADGDGVEPMNHCHGICITTGSAGATGTLLVGGNISGFSGLLIGADYYLSNTIGTITSVSNEGIFLGTAISATNINLQFKRNGKRNSRYLTMTSSSTAPFLAYCDGIVYATITCGTVSNGTNTAQAYVTNTYANATNPVSINNIVSQGGGGNIGTNTTAVVNMAFPMRKGERVQFTGSNTPSTTYFTFEPTN